MAATPGKPPKKEKRQSPQERLEAMRYNHMMYGPTAGERRAASKKTNYGTAYLNHPKFQELMTAFKKGLAFRFEVTDKGRVYPIATEGSQILFDGKILFYARPSGRQEDTLLLDRSSAVRYQGTEALVHLVFAVLRSFPEIGTHPLYYLDRQFYCGSETLDAGIDQQGPNLLIGTFRHSRAHDRART